MGKSKKKKSKPSPVVELSENIDEEASELCNGSYLEPKDSTCYSVEDLMERVDEYMGNCEYELAAMFCRRALQRDSKHVQALVTLGIICMETGNVEEARAHLIKAVDFEPDKGYLKYSYLGQLSEGYQALQFYLKALQIMKEQQGDAKVCEEGADQMVKSISTTFCALAELYMTDLCMEANAEDECSKYSKLAIESDPNNLEAYIAMTNFLLSKDDVPGAKENCKQAYQLWIDLSESLGDAVPETLSYEARLNLVKLSIELEEFDHVPRIVEQLIEEDEDDIHLWYYMGLAKSLQQGKESPQYYLTKALEIYEKCGLEDPEMLSHIHELLKSCSEDVDVVAKDMDAE